MSNGWLRYVGVPAALVALVALGGASVPVLRSAIAPGSDDPPWSGVARVIEATANLRLERETAVSALQKEMKAAASMILARQVAGNLIGMQSRYCEAVRLRQATYAQAMAEEIARLQDEYWSYTSRFYTLRACP